MSYLDCAQYDCCHNKAGCCCLNDIKVHHTGESDAVCSSYRNSEGYGNVATDNQPASPETAAAATSRGIAAAPAMSAWTPAAAAPPALHGRQDNRKLRKKASLMERGSLFVCFLVAKHRISLYNKTI